MKNKDLKTGMILVTEADKYVMVLKDTENGDIVSGDTWQPIYENSDVVEDLRVKKIYRPLNNRAYLAKDSGFMNRNIKEDYNVNCCTFPWLEDYELIWERKNKKEMTISEIEKELGYSIKIVKENEKID